jgi:8-hydroxy-5-deazaflavin:NADPH oxidoreductase
LKGNAMTKHRITVLGTGDMGGAIIQALTERTQHIIAVRGSRARSASATALVDRLGVREASEADIEHSDIVFVVVPTKAILAIEPLLREYRGIVVSVSVSGAAGRDGQKSVAEQLADAAPGARIVNAFTSIWSDVVREPGNAGKTSAFVCSDDDDAKAIVMKLADELGFEPINGGKLSVSLYAEALGVFAVRLALDSGYGRTISFRAFKANA